MYAPEAAMKTALFTLSFFTCLSAFSFEGQPKTLSVQLGFSTFERIHIADYEIDTSILTECRYDTCYIREEQLPKTPFVRSGEYVYMAKFLALQCRTKQESSGNHVAESCTAIQQVIVTNPFIPYETSIHFNYNGNDLNIVKFNSGFQDVESTAPFTILERH